ncbi:serine/threonine-protein kinase [Dactylosporangium sp. CA-139066]|uniref:serine/threonine-protein kinase n=1 Tax=Dactylosporangium sp. CA-139066 TaxID=3239930 RepID=UPI003D8C605D
MVSWSDESSRRGPASVWTAGMRVHDRFALRERIGTGGMSEVWRAEDEVLGRAVAVKMLTAPLAMDPLLRAATWTEARAAARLAHPHVTQVYDYGEAALPNGTTVAYLVMELVEGQSLADRLRQGPLPWPEATAVAAEVAAALAAAHRVGVVHRDIKPGNVMLTAAGAKILDFGIAALGGGESAADGDRLVGTPAYAAPERLQPGAAAPESDVYALGVLLYEALTGRRPVKALTWQEAAEAHRAAAEGAPAPPLDVPGLPRQVRRLCMDCLSADPAQRPTAEDAARGLAAAAGRQPPVTTALPTVVGAPPPATHAPPSSAQGARAGYAVGSAPLPHPATTVAPAELGFDVEPDGVAERHLPRPVLAALVGAVVVLGVALAVVTAMLLSRPPDQTAQSAGSGAPSGQPSQTTQAGSSGPPATTASPLPAATTPQEIADRLEATIADAIAAGTIDAKAADKLREKVDDLRQNAGRGKVRKSAQELQRTIDQLRKDGQVDDQTAAQLIRLLRPLLSDD